MSASSGTGANQPAVGAHSAAYGPADGAALLGPAVRNVQALAAIVRGRDLGPVERFVDALTREELVAALVTAAALLPARFGPAQRLAWIDLDPIEWSDRLLTGETSRWDDGDRDATARLAHEETGRRLAAMQARVRPKAS